MSGRSISLPARLLRVRRMGASHRATAGSLLSAFGSQGALIVSGVAVARMLGPEDRGYLALLMLVPVILSHLFCLGLPQAVPFFLAREPGQSGRITRMLVAPIIAQSVVISLLYVVVCHYLLAGDPAYVRTAGWIALATGPMTLLRLYMMAVLQGRQEFRAFNVLRVMPALIYGLGAFVAFFAGVGTLAVVTALWLLSQAVVALAAAGIVYRQSTPEREPQDGSRVTLGQMLRFGVEGLLGSTSPVETFRLDQALIGVFLSPIALGYYVVGLSFTNLPRFVAQSFGVVAYPLVAADRNAHSARRSMWTFFTVSVAFTAVFVIVLEISAGWFVPFFFGDEYREAIPVCRILLLYALFVSARRVLADGARGAGLPMSGTVAEVAAWAVLLPLLPFSVRWGVDAVGWSLTLSSLVGLVVLLWYLSSGRSRQHEAADVAVAGG